MRRGRHPTLPRHHLYEKTQAEVRKKVAAGKQPYYPKRSEIKQKILDDRFNELKKSGKLNKFLVRKARKAQTKFNRQRPNRAS